jgi:hypothetical protein
MLIECCWLHWPLLGTHAKIRRRFGLSDALVVKIIAGFEGLLATACFDF